MKNFLNITILTLSVGLASAPVLARQAVDPTDYVGYTHGAYKISLASVPIDINPASAPVLSQAVDPTDYIGYVQGAGASAEPASSDHSTDGHESKRIGKLLWKSNHVQVGYGNVK